MTDRYVVICRADRKPDGTPGDYVLTTRRVFDTRVDAETYAATVNVSRDPLVVEGRWFELRSAPSRNIETARQHLRQIEAAAAIAGDTTALLHLRDIKRMAHEAHEALEDE